MHQTTWHVIQLPSHAIPNITCMWGAANTCRHYPCMGSHAAIISLTEKRRNSRPNYIFFNRRKNRWCENYVSSTAYSLFRILKYFKHNKNNPHLIFTYYKAVNTCMRINYEFYIWKCTVEISFIPSGRTFFPSMETIQQLPFILMNRKTSGNRAIQHPPKLRSGAVAATSRFLQALCADAFQQKSQQCYGPEREHRGNRSKLQCTHIPSICACQLLACRQQRQRPRVQRATAHTKSHGL